MAAVLPHFSGRLLFWVASSARVKACPSRFERIVVLEEVRTEPEAVEDGPWCRFDSKWAAPELVCSLVLLYLLFPLAETEEAVSKGV